MRNSATVGEALRALLLHSTFRIAGPFRYCSAWTLPMCSLATPSIDTARPATEHLYDAAIAIRVQDAEGDLRPCMEASTRPVRPRSAEGCATVSSPPWSKCSIRRRGVRHRVRSILARPCHPRRGFQPPRTGHAGPPAGASQPVVWASPTWSGARSNKMVLSARRRQSVALLFGVHERTVRKRLSAEGTSLQRLVCQTRFELAKQTSGEHTTSTVGDRPRRCTLQMPRSFRGRSAAGQGRAPGIGAHDMAARPLLASMNSDKGRRPRSY